MDDVELYLAGLRAERKRLVAERRRLMNAILRTGATRRRLCAERDAILTEILAKQPTLRWHLAHHGHPRFVGQSAPAQPPTAATTDEIEFDDTVVPLRRRSS